jgi:glycosyltransferase 2 family protein
MHLVWFVGAIAFAGSSAFGNDVELPDGWILLAGFVLVLSASGVIAFLPRARRWLVERARPALVDLAADVRRPAKAAQLLGGAAAQTGCALVAFGASLAAVGAGTPTGTMIIVYLGGSTVAAAAPTPGGLGAVEAALVAGLTATGTPTDLAVAGVLVFRAITYWATFLPGWLAMHALRRAGRL